MDDRPGDDPDRLAEDRAARLAGAADLVVAVVDAAAPQLPALDPDGAPVLLAWNKVDLEGAGPEPTPSLLEGVGGWVRISAATGAGVEDLERAALGLIETREASATGAGIVGLGARHLRSLAEAHAGVERALEGLSLDGAPLDQVAEELRGATDALDGIAGRTTPEDLLDRIFAQFCLGK